MLRAFTFRHLRQIPSADLTGKVQEPPSSCRPPSPHPFPDLECPKCCTGMPMMYLHRWSDNPAAARAWVGWFKFWRWSSVSVLYLPVVETVLIYVPSCQVERGNILTIFLKTCTRSLLLPQSDFLYPDELRQSETLRDLRTPWEAFVYLCLEETQSLGKLSFRDVLNIYKQSQIFWLWRCSDCHALQIQSEALSAEHMIRLVDTQSACYLLPFAE